MTSKKCDQLIASEDSDAQDIGQTFAQSEIKGTDEQDDSQIVSSDEEESDQKDIRPTFARSQDSCIDNNETANIAQTIVGSRSQNDASAHELQRLKNSGREIHIPESCVENKPVPVVADTPESVEEHLKCLKNLTSDFYQKMRTETAWLNSKSIWTGSRAYPYQNKEVSRNISDWMYNFGKIYKQIMDMEPFQIEPERSIYICTSNEEDE